VTDPIERTLAYHQRTKHQLQRYARSLGYLDWATQPDPFRTYAGAPRVELPLAADRLTTSFAALHRPGAVPAKPLSLTALGVFFELALGLSAWKQYQKSRWALRCNPSSGNLHPTEGYALVPELPGLPAGIYHYVSRDHGLEQRCAVPPPLAPGTFLVGLSSIHWREAWKYGERAFRYCQHDAGHAIATARYVAAALGWSAILLDDLSDDDRATLMGLNHAASFAQVAPLDREHPDALLLIRTNPAERVAPALDVEPFRSADWLGQANPLSPAHVEWSIIDDVAQATWKPPGSLPPEGGSGGSRPGCEDLSWIDSVPPCGGGLGWGVGAAQHVVGASSSSHEVMDASPPPQPSPIKGEGASITAATLIRQRRSCLALDGTTSIGAAAFYAILDRLLPRPNIPPWDALPWRPHVHCGIFVHRVDGLKPGLYLFERRPAVHDALRAATRSDLAWQRVPGCPAHLRLFLLAEQDLRQVAQTVSCHQDIASDGAFSLGMLAEFGDAIRQHGAWWYRRLFWEAGVLGQVLYLEAEAAGIRGTGIGCYFDDAFHDLLGLKGDAFQDLYHFTMGGPVDDPRLTTLPAYAHLGR
jgi:SagB-type dehydrogenase family enzyme